VRNALHELSQWGITLVSAVGRSNLNEGKQNFAMHPVTCGNHNASCMLIFPFVPATFGGCLETNSTVRHYCDFFSPTFPTSQQFSLFSKQYSPTEQALLTHCSAKHFQLHGVDYYYYYYYYYNHHHQ
jgi:hypothetical protein